MGQAFSRRVVPALLLLLLAATAVPAQAGPAGGASPAPAGAPGAPDGRLGGGTLPGPVREAGTGPRAPVGPGLRTPAGARYPVVFIPGLGGTSLWNGDEHVWLNVWKAAGSQVPVLNWFLYDWLLPLRLQPDGEASFRPGYRIRTGEVLRTGVVGVYGGFLDSLADLGYREGKDLFVYPYDWRKGVAPAAGGLAGVVDRALRDNPGGKVVLVGHSMGGLVAREYIRQTAGARVEALIAVGTPWLGSPVTWKALERGWDLGLRIPGTSWSLRAPRTLHLLARDFPSVYQLLPGQRYADLYGGFVRRDGRPLPFALAKTEVVAPHNPKLAAGMGYVDSLLDGKSYGVRQYLAAGVGQDTLVAAEQGSFLGFPTWDEFMGDGDDTVPRYSADLGASRDPALPARLLGPVAGVAYVRMNHAFLMASVALEDQVAAWLGEIHARAPAAGARP